MATDVLMPMYRIYTNGIQLPAWMYGLITKVKFEEYQEIGSTSTLTIYVDDPELQFANSGLFVERTTVVRFTIGWSHDFDDVFEGIVEIIEDDYPQSGRITRVITCKDVTYKMSRADKNKAYKGLTYSDIVKQIAKSYGVEADVDDTTYIYDPKLKAGDVVNQPGMSDLKFIRYLADEINFKFEFDSSKRLITFKKPSNVVRKTIIDADYKSGNSALLSFKPKFNDYNKDKTVVSENITIQETPKMMAAATTDSKINIGDLVNFAGGNHYVSSDAKTPTGGQRTSGKAKVTNVNYKDWALHQIHLIGDKGAGGSNVYGWVDVDKVQKI